MMRKANTFIADELETKTNYLHQALLQAEKIIDMLETENQRLKDIINNICDSKTKDIHSEYLVI